jgi:hypothetical protein
MNNKIIKLPNGDFKVERDMDNVPHGADTEDAPWNEKEVIGECNICGCKLCADGEMFEDEFGMSLCKNCFREGDECNCNN